MRRLFWSGAIAGRAVETVDQLAKPAMAAAVEPEHDPGQIGDLRFVRLLGEGLPLGDRPLHEEIPKIRRRRFLFFG